jgi:hypothetical protein
VGLDGENPVPSGGSSSSSGRVLVPQEGRGEGLRSGVAGLPGGLHPADERQLGADGVRTPDRGRQKPPATRSTETPAPP